MNHPLRRIPDEELFDPSQFRPGHDSLTDTQIDAALDRLNPPPLQVSDELLKLIVTRVDPDWMEHYSADLKLAAGFIQQFESQAFERARGELGA